MFRAQALKANENCGTSWSNVITAVPTSANEHRYDNMTKHRETPQSSICCLTHACFILSISLFTEQEKQKNTQGTNAHWQIKPEHINLPLQILQSFNLFFHLMSFPTSAAKGDWYVPNWSCSNVFKTDLASSLIRSSVLSCLCLAWKKAPEWECVLSCCSLHRASSCSSTSNISLSCLCHVASTQQPVYRVMRRGWATLSNLLLLPR